MKMEPDELGTLLQAAMSDPLGTLRRILEQVFGQLSADPNTTAGTGPEALIAEAITRRLTALLATLDPGPSPDRSITVEADIQAAYYEELLDRNSSLATALGACDCWGTAPECPICQGEGSPGWALPDRTLFETYVQPAVTKLTDSHETPARDDGPKEQPRKDTDNDLIQ